MRVSLNWVKKYVDLPKEITNKQLSYDLTMRTVEVEDVIDTSLKFHDIIVGEILEVNKHPDADKLKVCMVNIGEESPVQIVCGGSNLYVGEKVVTRSRSILAWRRRLSKNKRNQDAWSIIIWNDMWSNRSISRRLFST